MSTQTIEMTYAVGIGIDVSKNKLDLAIRLSNQEYVESNFSNDADGILNLCTFLKRQEAAQAAPLVIESTGDYHLQSSLMIKQRNFNVKLINPIITKRYQKSSIRNAKTDKIDAKRLSDIAVLEEKLPDFDSTVTEVQNCKLISLLAHLEKQKQQMTLSIKRFKETAKIIGLKHSTKHLEKALSEIKLQIKSIETTLIQNVPEKIKEQAKNTKGISIEKLAIIHTLVASKQFNSADQLIAFFGLDVAVRKSGKWVGKSKLSKRGNPYARKILYQIAWGMKMHNEIFKTAYLYYREKHHYNAVLMILARKFLRYYFSYNFKSTTI